MRKVETSIQDEEKSLRMLETSEHVALTRCAMRFHPDVTYEEWSMKGEEIGLVTNMFVRHMPWWIGDWIIAGEKYFPHKYERAVSETLYSFNRLKMIVYACRNVDKITRNPNVSFEHHMVIAKLKDPAEQKFWLKQAEDNGWTLRVFRKELNKHLGIVRPTKKDLDGQVVGAGRKVECFDEWWDGYGEKSILPLMAEREKRIAQSAWEAGHE